MGVTLTFSLLDDLANLSPSILENALKNIYSVLIQLKSGLLKTDDYKFYEREQIFNRHRDYLVELVKSDKISDAIKQYAVKILIVIGNLRESGEDYLIAFNLIRQNNLKVNIDAELSQNIYFQELGSSNTEEIARKFKLLENESTEVEFMTGIGNDPNVNSHTNFTFDDKYVYLWNYNTGLFKIGMKSTISTKRGLIYSFSSTESAYLFKQVLFLKNKLYVRNYMDLNTPFKIYDRNTLEVIEPDDYKNNLIKCQRNNNSDAWNTQILEVTNSSYLEEAIRRGEAEKFRTLVETPLFTDGKHIYVISTYVIEGAYEKEEVGYEVEAYCPDTWKCIKSFKLILEPEQDQNISNEASMKIVEETEMIKNCLLQSSILKSYCATNGQTMTFTQNGKMFFFDLETGLRYPETIEVPKTDGGYNYLTNTFWHYNSSAKNPTLKSFKIDGFKNVIEDSSETVLNLSEAIKSHTKLVVEQQKSKTKPQQRNLEGFLKKLGSRSKPKFSESDIKTNESVSLSLYLWMYIVGRGWEELDKIMQKWAGDIMDKETKLNLQSSMFRSKFWVSISSTFISELLDSLEYFNQFVDEEMNDENILEQYQFMWIIKLAHRFITSLEKLNLTLDEIINDETEDSGSIIADKFKGKISPNTS